MQKSMLPALFIYSLNLMEWNLTRTLKKNIVSFNKYLVEYCQLNIY